MSEITADPMNLKKVTPKNPRSPITQEQDILDCSDPLQIPLLPKDILKTQTSGNYPIYSYTRSGSPLLPTYKKVNFIKNPPPLYLYSCSFNNPDDVRKFFTPNFTTTNFTTNTGASKGSQATHIRFLFKNPSDKFFLIGYLKFGEDNNVQYSNNVKIKVKDWSKIEQGYSIEYPPNAPPKVVHYIISEKANFIPTQSNFNASPNNNFGNLPTANRKKQYKNPNPTITLNPNNPTNYPYFGNPPTANRKKQYKKSNPSSLSTPTLNPSNPTNYPYFGHLPTPVPIPH